MSDEPSMVNYYDVLDVSQDATLQEINAAYKKLALKYHPDKSGDQFLETFHEIKEAAEVLRDPKLRLEHDESLESFHESRNRSRVYRPRKQKEEWEEWAEDNPSWRNMDLNGNLRNSQDCYMYSYGSSVHMDPYSEESMAESARRSEEADKWQAEYSTMQAEYEADQQQAEREKKEYYWPFIDELPEELSESEPDTIEQVQNETLRRDAQVDFLTSEPSEQISREPLEHEIWTEDFEAFLGTEQPTDLFPSTTYNDFERHGSYSSFGSPIYSFEPRFSSVSASPFETEPPFDGFESPLDDYEDYLGEVELGLRDPIIPYTPATSQQQPHESIPQIVTADGPLKPFCEYFNAKLADPSVRYTLDDLSIEINGMLAGIFSDWVIALKNGPRPSPGIIAPDGDRTCTHLCECKKDFNVLECPACHFQRPMYAATCSGCGTQRCLCCK